MGDSPNPLGVPTDGHPWQRISPTAPTSSTSALDPRLRQHCSVSEPPTLRTPLPLAALAARASQRGRLQPLRLALRLLSLVPSACQPPLSPPRLNPAHARQLFPFVSTGGLPWLRTSTAAPTYSVPAYAPAPQVAHSRALRGAKRTSFAPLPLCSNGAPPSPPTWQLPMLVKAHCSSASTALVGPLPSFSPRPPRQPLLLPLCMRCCHLSVALLLERRANAFAFLPARVYAWPRVHGARARRRGLPRCCAPRCGQALDRQPAKLASCVPSSTPPFCVEAYHFRRSDR